MNKDLIVDHACIYTFHREGMFYPLYMPKGDAEAIANAHCNPGTQEVRCGITGRLVWSDGKDGRPSVGDQS